MVGESRIHRTHEEQVDENLMVRGRLKEIMFPLLPSVGVLIEF
jgi:hypothetical protein